MAFYSPFAPLSNSLCTPTDAPLKNEILVHNNRTSGILQVSTGSGEGKGDAEFITVFPAEVIGLTAMVLSPNRTAQSDLCCKALLKPSGFQGDFPRSYDLASAV